MAVDLDDLHRLVADDRRKIAGVADELTLASTNMVARDAVARAVHDGRPAGGLAVRG
jgi:hypothetical protein